MRNLLVVRNPNNPDQWLWRLGRVSALVAILAGVVVSIAAGGGDKRKWSVSVGNCQIPFHDCTDLFTSSGFVHFKTSQGLAVYSNDRVTAFEQFQQKPEQE